MTQATLKTARSRYLLVGVVIPLLASAVAVGLQLAWLKDLPDPAATHFSGSGPDGFGPGWTYPLITALVGVGLIALSAVMVMATTRDGRWSFTLMRPGFVGGSRVTDGEWSHGPTQEQGTPLLG